MRIESAQEIKQKILEMSESAAVLQFGAARSFQRGGGAAPLPQSIAVGISFTPEHQYRPALRLGNEADLETALAKFAFQIARGEVDLRVVGAVRQQMPWKRQRQRPPMIGCSISHIDGTAGTLGCFVRDRATEEVLALSNNHVIMRNDLAAVGDPILQPGPIDGGVAPGALVGRALRAVRLDAQPGAVNWVDAALGRFDAGSTLDRADKSLLQGLGRLAATAPAMAQPGDRVAKLGRTTGVTWGTVVSADIDRLQVASAFDPRMFRFDNQIEIEGDNGQPFSRGGDSGSLVVNERFEPVGLIFCGSEAGGDGAGLSYANHIGQVLDDLAVDIVA